MNENWVREHEKKVFFGIIGIFTFLRAFLLGKGVFGLTDEGRYLRAYHGFCSLVENGSLSGFFHEIIINASSPGSQLLSMIPVSCQYIIEKTTGLSHLSPVSLMVPQFFNLTFLFFTSYLFYRLCKILFQENLIAIAIGLIMYFSFINTNLFVRHLLPYDLVLFFIFFTLLYILTKLSPERSDHFLFFKTGLLTLFTFSVYPGYYFFLPLSFGLICFTHFQRIFTKNFFIDMLAYSMGLGIPVVLYEIMGRVAGTSYIAGLVLHSSTILQGDFDEGFSFLPEYFKNVESGNGMMLMVLSLIAFYLVMKKVVSSRFDCTKLSITEATIILTVFGVLFHCMMSWYFEKMVWYGRIVHFYIPFLVVSVMYILVKINVTQLKSWLYFIIIVGSLFSISKLYREYYLSIGYPKNVLYDLKIDSGSVPNKLNQSEIKFGSLVESPAHYATGKKYYANEKEFALKNFVVFWPILTEQNPYNNIDYGSGFVQVYSKQHYNSYLPYIYEGYDRAQRKIMRKNKIDLVVYEKVIK